MTEYTYITEEGTLDIYSDSLVTKTESKPGALETPIHEDTRGKIERKTFGDFKYNIIETKKGFMRSGDIHKNTQFDLVLSGKIEIWTLVKGETKKTIVESNQYVVVRPNTPHLFNFLEDTVMIEYWNGPFETWYYKPYRDIIDQNFKNNK
jgi:mannose-6-phosphate isomerase-like protein (cupin superfamily)